ncbi:hypothetical protein PPERSA_02647 [Pseudocohnilembus persalinus]|uniref:HAD-like domain n=1 Tax=Pseudocohnilembus persalinus TaxID=266149 RepID=A0A0V0R5L0_PSEPJ|nr:hypothetical protein PPERSA_02647 [Pseudocohnilembus persalinus]|eukprot:KRX09775.1 hypothetical protein PPERSA_02647 [Pseudocohnilembus persalinus]
MEEEEQQKNISHKCQSNDTNSNSQLQQQKEKTEEKETQQQQETLENLKKQKKQLGIEIFVDIDGTIFNDPSLHVAILSKIKKQSKKNYQELINNQEFLNSILETENMIRPGIKEKLLPFFEEMRKRFNFIHFSIFTSNRQMESYQKIINQLEKNLNIPQIFKSYHLASDYNEKNIKDIELVSPYKYSYIIDNNHTIKTDMVQNLIRVMTFQAPEYLSEQNRKYYQKYLSNQEIDEIIMYKNEKQVLNKNQEINHIPNQERWLNEMESIIQQINIIISDLISQDEELQLKLM